MPLGSPKPSPNFTSPGGLFLSWSQWASAASPESACPRGTWLSFCSSRQSHLPLSVSCCHTPPWVPLGISPSACGAEQKGFLFPGPTPAEVRTARGRRFLLRWGLQKARKQSTQEVSLNAGALTVGCKEDEWKLGELSPTGLSLYRMLGSGLVSGCGEL